MKTENPKLLDADFPARVLVVDDESAIRFSFKAYLKGEGFNADVAENGEMALEKIHDFDPQVVLLDILMPGVTGNELVETIKGWRPRIEVIMVTSVDREEVKQECLSKGAFAVLLKPVNPPALVATIQKAIENQRRKGSIEDLTAPEAS